MPVLRSIAVAAYQQYVPRIGRPPAPMTADYHAAARHGQAWVATEDGQAVGFIILIPQPGYLLVENGRRCPQPRAAASGPGCWPWPKTVPAACACPRSGSTPTTR